MSITKQVVFEDAEGVEHEVDLPAAWRICSDCDGAGQSSADFGAITADEWNGPDWDDESREAYLSGAYDKPCRHCNGSGKVLEVHRKRCVLPEQSAALAYLDQRARDDALDRSIIRSEMALLGEY